MKEASKWPLIVLLIALPLLALALYWYLNTPQVAVFKNQTTETFLETKNFEAADLKPYGDGIVVVVPTFSRNADNAYVDLEIAVWSKQPSRAVQIKDLTLSDLNIPSKKSLFISASEEDNGSKLYVGRATAIEKLPVADVIEAARKNGGKLNLVLTTEINENVPQRRVIPLTMTYPFTVKAQHVTPWAP